MCYVKLFLLMETSTPVWSLACAPQVFSQEVVLRFVPRYSLIAELRDGGVCVRTFHDPNGEVAAYVSEAHEYQGSLYIGSFRSPYVAKLDLSQV